MFKAVRNGEQVSRDTTLYAEVSCSDSERLGPEKTAANFLDEIDGFDIACRDASTSAHGSG